MVNGPPAVKLETRLLLDRIGFWTGIAGVAVAVLGEVLGWWNDVGAWLAGLSVSLSALTLLDLTGKRLGQKQDAMLGMQDTLLGTQDAMLEKQDAMLGKQDAMLDHQEATLGVLERIERLLDERLPPSA